jgi:tetratricopeptide (TPR) repeat protein
VAVFVLLAALVAMAYANSLENWFVVDDELLIEHNPLITRLEYLPRLLTSDYWAGSRDPQLASRMHSGRYRPLLLSTFALQHWWSGLDARPFHAANVVLHFVVTWLLYVLALRVGLSVGGAAVAAILFAVHPLHTEPVAMLVGRAELLMSLGVLAGLLWAAQGRRWLSLVAFACALLSKEQAAVFPVLLALYDVCVSRLYTSRRASEAMGTAFARYGWYVLFLGLYLLVRALVVGKVVSSQVRFLEDPFSYLPWSQWLASVIKAAGLYLRLCLWPADLSADYSYNSIPAASSIGDPGVLFALLVWGSLLGLAVRLWRKGERRGAFFLGLTALTFLPGSNLLVPVGTPMAERLFYLPSAGLCLLAGMAWQYAAARYAPMTLPMTVAVGLLVLLNGALLARTVERNRDWMSTETIALSMLRVFPENAKAHFWVGTVALERGDWDEVLRHYREALRIYPEFATVEPVMSANLGLALVETGQRDEGLARIERAIAMEPTWSMLRWVLGVAHGKQGRYEEAEAAFRQAVELNQQNHRAHFGLSYLYLEQGRYEAAREESELAIRWKPDFMEPRYVRARALAELGRDAEAIEEYEWLARHPRAPADVPERLATARARFR